MVFDSSKLKLDYHPSNGEKAYRLDNVEGSEACSEEGGWYYNDNADPTRMILCEDSCSEVDDDFDGYFEVWFDCPT